MDPQEIKTQKLTELKNTLAKEWGYPDFEKLVHYSAPHDIDLATNVIVERYAEATGYSSFYELTALQRGFGYQAGELNPVAILGLFGEAGEVLNEVYFPEDEYREGIKAMAASVAYRVDQEKKRIRQLPISAAPKVIFSSKDGTKFDLELADQLYYICLCALGRNKTLEYYAQLSIDKVKAKALKAPKDGDTE